MGGRFFALKVSRRERERRPLTNLDLDLSFTKKIISAASSTSEALVALSALHGRDLSKALLLLERRAVSLFVGQPSGRRSAFVAAGGGAGGGGSGGVGGSGGHSTLSPHFCSCESFFFDVVGRGEKPACKHLIAAQVAEALAEEKAPEREGGEGEQGEGQGRQQQLPPPSAVSPLAAFAPSPTLVPDDVLARLLIAG